MLDPAAVLFRVFSDAATLTAAADGILTAEEQRVLLWDSPPRTKGAARWSRADLALLDEVADLLDRTPSLGHVVLDEAQDLSPMQLRAVGRRASTGSLTVLGDIAQGTTPWATESWGDAMGHLGPSAHELVVLDRGFRVPALVIDFAARLLPHMAPGLGAPRRYATTPVGSQSWPPTSAAARPRSPTPCAAALRPPGRSASSPRMPGQPRRCPDYRRRGPPRQAGRRAR